MSDSVDAMLNDDAVYKQPNNNNNNTGDGGSSGGIGGMFGNATNAASGMFGKMTDMMGGSVLQVSAISVLIFVVVVAIVVWIFMAYLRPTRGVVIPNTKSPVNGQVLSVLDVPPIKMTNGIAASVSFWLYIHDPVKYAGMHRHVFHVGGPDSVKPFPTENPTDVQIMNEKDAVKVFLGKRDTKLTVSFGSTFIQIKYVPVQRWTHICVTVSDNNTKAGGQIIAYADGVEVEKKANIMTGRHMASVNTNLYGTLYVGGDNIKAVPFSGLLGQTTFFNYELNTRDINRVYRNGPVAGLAKYGLAWGIRSPVYKLN